jgi:hypothetical protein
MLLPRPATLALVVSLAALLPAGSPRAQFGDELQRQAQCELSAIGTTRSRLALSWIKTACNRLAVDFGSLNQSNQQFYQCLLSNLSGVQRDEAAAQVINSCRVAYPP